jgi:hypothetical protein
MHCAHRDFGSDAVVAPPPAQPIDPAITTTNLGHGISKASFSEPALFDLTFGYYKLMLTLNNDAGFAVRLLMHWFRHHIIHSASLALIALAINFALSFGHIHLDGLPGGKVMAGVLVSALTHQDDGQTNKHHQADPDDFCPICMAGAALGTGIAASPPVLIVQFAEAAIERPFEAVVSVLQSHRTAFQSRGPPIS